jgi:hypothetical protein
MRKLMVVMFACLGSASSFVPSVAQTQELSVGAQPKQEETFCYEAQGPADCVPTTDRRYQVCSDLAFERGWRDASQGRNRFIYECLTGTIGTAPK